MSQHEQKHVYVVWKVKSGIIAGEKLLLMYQIISSCYMARHVSVQSLCFHPASVLRRSCWGLTEESGMEVWGVGWDELRGGGGVSLKGIITVSPEYVHNHSVKQTGVGERREHISICVISSCSSTRWEESGADDHLI